MTTTTTGAFRPAASGTLRAEDLIPHSYLLTIERQACACGNTYTFHRLNLVYVHPDWTASTKFRKLQPVEKRLRSDLPVGVSRLPDKRIDLCENCIATVLQPDPRPYVTDKQWAETLAHEARAAKQRASKPKPSATPSIDIMKLEF